MIQSVAVSNRYFLRRPLPRHRRGWSWRPAPWTNCDAGAATNFWCGSHIWSSGPTGVSTNAQKCWWTLQIMGKSSDVRPKKWPEPAFTLAKDVRIATKLSLLKSPIPGRDEKWLSPWRCPHFKIIRFHWRNYQRPSSSDDSWVTRISIYLGNENIGKYHDGRIIYNPSIQ